MSQTAYTDTARSQLARFGTLPFAFVGELAWNLSWPVLIPVGAVLKRRARRKL